MTLETLLRDQRVAEMSAALTKRVSVCSIWATSIHFLSAAACPALRVAAGDDPSCSLGWRRGFTQDKLPVYPWAPSRQTTTCTHIHTLWSIWRRHLPLYVFGLWEEAAVPGGEPMHTQGEQVNSIQWCPRLENRTHNHLAGKWFCYLLHYFHPRATSLSLTNSHHTAWWDLSS